jgi:hypothetical protein
MTTALTILSVLVAALAGANVAMWRQLKRYVDSELADVWFWNSSMRSAHDQLAEDVDAINAVLGIVLPRPDKKTRAARLEN